MKVPTSNQDSPICKLYQNQSRFVFEQRVKMLIVNERCKVIAQALSGVNVGFDSHLLTVECDMTNNLPGILIVGLGSKAVDESRERIKSAIKNSNLELPRKKFTLNLAPADIPKDGTQYDLPMAVSILCASGQIDRSKLKQYMFVGELSLEGKLRPTKGILGYIKLARKNNLNIVIPDSNKKEANIIKGVNILLADSLESVYRHLTDEARLQSLKPRELNLDDSTYHESSDFAQIYGQSFAKRAMEIVAAGHHNILLTGPPGTGKTMLAKSLVSILPPPSYEEMMDINTMHSLASTNNFSALLCRPFRSPHHTSSTIALVGGGKHPKPGEISLSNHGVLFLDELPEYPRQALESLRQPLEDNVVTVARVSSSVAYPAKFILVATQNPCPCGYASDPKRECTCTTQQIVKYQKKISGPLLDRIDLVVEVANIDQSKIFGEFSNKDVETSGEIRKRVINARNMQLNRYGTSRKTNSDMSNEDIKRYCKLDEQGKSLLLKAIETFQLSTRAHTRILKVARTIADLHGESKITSPHIGEAIQYRKKY